ncbi:MAG: hypothetical protein U9R42_10570 [Bacteroidota bacterium]|nr:hypothetical protein [Bacteroidota bacterium]
MKQILKVIIFMFFVSNVFAQSSESQACKYLKESSKAHCKGKFKKSARILKRFVSKFPEHQLNEEAKLSIGISYLKVGKYKKAERFFNELIKIKDYPDDETLFDFSKCNYLQTECASFLKSDRMLSIQHEAFIYLAEISLERENWNSAFENIVNADKYYRYWYGCGTGDLQEDIRLSLLYSKYYLKINKSDSALKVLLPLVLEPAALPILHYSELVEKTLRLLKQKYDKDELKTIVDKAIDEVYFQNLDKYKHGGRVYFIKLLDVKVKVAPEYLFQKNKNPEEVKDYIKKTDFYKKILE